jgi:hypothetical protein
MEDNIKRLRGEIEAKVRAQPSHLHYSIDAQLPLVKPVSVPPEIQLESVLKLKDELNTLTEKLCNLVDHQLPSLQQEFNSLKDRLDADEKKLESAKEQTAAFEDEERNREGVESAMASARVRIFSRHQNERAKRAKAEWAEYERKRQAWIEDFKARDPVRIQKQRESIERTRAYLQKVCILSCKSFF